MDESSRQSTVVVLDDFGEDQEPHPSTVAGCITTEEQWKQIDPKGAKKFMSVVFQLLKLATRNTLGRASSKL